MTSLLASISWPVLDRIHFGSKLALSPHGLGIALGFLLGSVWVLKDCPRRGIREDHMSSMLFWALIGTIVGARLLNLDRAAAAEFSFFLAMPTMVAAFVYKLLDVKDFLTRDRALEIGVGFLMAFLAALVVVRPFLTFVTRSGFAPFAWYRIALGAAILVALGAGWL